MSHTRKKFVNQIEVDFDIGEIKPNEPSELPKKISYQDFDQAYIQTDDKVIIQGFLYLKNSQPIVIPEPEPSILYFTNAEKDLNEILRLQEIILSSIGFKNAEKIANLFFNFFQFSSNFIINLSMSIEAFNNAAIPNDYRYKVPGKRKTIKKDQIQRFSRFKDKVENIIPDIFDKSFAKHADLFEYIFVLKNLRDSIIHTKNFSTNYAASYRQIFRECLDFDFQKAYTAVKDYMNFYIESFIEDCDCGNVDQSYKA